MRGGACGKVDIIVGIIACCRLTSSSAPRLLVIDEGIRRSESRDKETNQEIKKSVPVADDDRDADSARLCTCDVGSAISR